MNGKEIAGKIQVVINTLQTLNITASFDNMNHMMGVYQTLAGIRDELSETEGGSENAGSPDAE